MKSFFCSYAAPMVSWELRTTPYCMHPVFLSSRRQRFPFHRELGALQSTTATAAKTSLLKWIGVFFQTSSRLFLFAENVKCRWISGELISWGPHSSLERERKIRRRLFASSIKRENRKFHVVFAQWWQRKIQKCDARAKLLFCKN